MRIFRRRAAEATKESVLAEARKATARLRRDKAKAEHYRAGKQADPQREMTTNQWLAGGS